MSYATHPANGPFSRHRFLFLFLFLLMMLIFYPYAESSRFAYYALRVAGSVAILLALYAVSFRRSVLILAIVLAIPSLYARGLLPQISISWYSVATSVLSFAFDIFLVVIIFQFVFARQQTTAESIFGALCVYILLGFSFASLYGFVLAFQPNGFYLDPKVNLHQFPDRFDLIYYSFGTMTSMGAPGIVPVTAEIRSLTMLETVLGVLYLAVLIAQLMDAYRPVPRDQDRP